MGLLRRLFGMFTGSGRRRSPASAGTTHGRGGMGGMLRRILR